MLKQRHQTMVSLLVAADGLAIASACALAYTARLVSFDEPLPASWEGYFKRSLVLFAIPITLTALRFIKLYRPRRDKSLWGEMGSVLKASFVAVAFLVVALWAVGSGFLTEGITEIVGPKRPGWRLATDPARFQLAILAMALPVLLGVQRTAFRLVLRQLRERGLNLRHIAVVGVGRLGQITAQTLERNSWTGLKVAYFISHHEEGRRRRCLDRAVEGGLSDLEATLEKNPVDAVYLALPSAIAAELPVLLRRLERFAVDVRVVPDVHPRYLPQGMRVSELEGMPILSYRESPITGLGGFTKRLLDLGGAGLACVLFVLPMLVIAGLVRLSGSGPVIFRQHRVSLGGEVFNIYKFRTMRHITDEQSPASWTSRDDDRITPIGRFLRKTSLDELPQLFNVLRGEMSLVGPRPERPELIERFRDDWRGYMIRQHVKAGITGWAQVNGLRGDTSLKKRLQYDLFYIRHWSVWLDLRILVLTPLRGFIHRNAH